MNELQYMLIAVPLATLHIPRIVETKGADGNSLKFKVKGLDKAVFCIARWSDTPNLCVGVPVVPGIPVEHINRLAASRLYDAYEASGAPWPEGAEIPRIANKPSVGQN